MLRFRAPRFSFGSLLVFTAFATQLSFCLADALVERSTQIPAPVSVTPDQNWDGIDGQWSTFTLRVGTPQQFVRTFVSTASQQTWVVLAEACSDKSDVQACTESRGWTYNTSQSSTWDQIGFYMLWTERNMGYSGNGQYGYDTVGLGGLGSEGPTLKNTTVGGFDTTNFYLGIFGINPKPTNFSSFNDPSPSYITYLKQDNLIPSVSFGYTAGAQYRFTKVLASLTLGGYDTSRFVPNNLTFGFAPDNERDIVVGLQSIAMNDQTKSNIDLLPTPVFMYIDSTIPEIWLPLDACKAFESAFGLTYDNATNLYLVNDALHSRLLAESANVTFTLGQKTTGGETVEIVLPYAAFDLVAKPPYRGLQNSSNYFPLRRAANESQYVFGRTFLQEAYLVVDWERFNFSVYQCSWVFGASAHILPIYSPGTAPNVTNTTGSTPDHPVSSHLSTAKIIGIAVGVGFSVAIIAFLLIWWFSSEKSEDEPPNSPGSPPANETNVFPKAELPAEPTIRHEMCSGSDGLLKPEDVVSGFPSPTSEVEGSERKIYEMPGDIPPRLEAGGRQLSEKETMMVRERIYNGVELAPPPSSPIAEETPKRIAPVSPSEVTIVNRRGLQPPQNVSPITPRTPRDGRDLEADDMILSPLSPMDDSTEGSSSRRRFSYE
ncbi:acid protease [Glonium stellatum]|uniref:Acid protease n=1 Tax=Glonium stellatum TaxID=574774 RepID=A0A8E2JTG6_9PEZI|nr:acid protease [Glonium stellatum]